MKTVLISHREMLVVIATSLKVTDEDLKCFQSNFNINYCLHFHMKNDNMYDFDSIDSYNTMTRLRTEIMKIVRQKSKKGNVDKIHLVLATSSDFAFYLAQDFSKQHDPEVIVYQYSNISAEKYPWGISCNSAPEKAVILNKSNCNL